MLSVDGVQKSFGEFSAEFDLHIASAERVALVGESGGGKSTLVNLIAGFAQPDEGTIKWQGEMLNRLPPHRRPVTTLFQDNNLFDHLDVFVNLALGIDPTGKTDEAGRANIMKVLGRVGLDGFERRMPTTLSGGQRQRVALARCLLRNRPLLLLDEPYGALDADTRRTMLKLTDDLLSESALTLLLVTHDIGDAHALNARIVRCHQGRLEADSGSL
ncbi:MAG: ATP-binding cassette domain-containing protein [Chromatiales bacterium]|nr:ATP-binding cassette domain-containing protein [Chromatiales bacterium]